MSGTARPAKPVLILVALAMLFAHNHALATEADDCGRLVRLLAPGSGRATVSIANAEALAKSGRRQGGGFIWYLVSMPGPKPRQFICGRNYYGEYLFYNQRTGETQFLR